jgi:hypothetical protein
MIEIHLMSDLYPDGVKVLFEDLFKMARLHRRERAFDIRIIELDNETEEILFDGPYEDYMKIWGRKPRSLNYRDN